MGASQINLQVGHEYGARAIQQTIVNSAGQPTGVHLEGWLQDITARGPLTKISTYDDMEPGDLGVKPYYNLPNSRIGTRQDGLDKKAPGKFVITFRQIPLSPIRR
ncbi:MAG: hypothetical protein WBQ25_12970 [Nitrososphaeraceae archaeon]